MHDFRQYRRVLPHWRLERATYFVTWRLGSGQPELTPRERSLVVDAVRYREGDRFALPAYVVMNDHVHALVTPSRGVPLETIVHSWKSFTANRLQRLSRRRGSVWQEEYFDRIVRDEREFAEKCGYIFSNPARRWPEAAGYPWVGGRAIVPAGAEGHGHQLGPAWS